MITFEESGLKPEILRAIADMGFTKPTPVQEETLPLLHEPPTNLIALAQTGTGKTAAFGLPLIHRIDAQNKNTQALVLCPTRELCLQITKDFENYMKYLPKIAVTAIYGGAPIHTQERQLNKGSQIVVGTPGRVIDMIKRKALDLSNIEWFILDEADEMLNMGFKDDLEIIFNETPKEKASWLFSATMPPRVESISKRYMKDAQRIAVGKRNEGAANVSHEYYVVQARDRFEALRRIVAVHDEFYGVVFCRTRQETTDVSSKLISMGYPAEAISGALSQQQRDHVMNRFRKGQLKLLIATDVAARGIDIDDLTHVINFQLPDDPEVYVHRSGRTGRAGKSGIAVSIIHGRQKNKIRELEKMTGKTFQVMQVPTMDEIGRKKVLALAEEMINAKVKGKGVDSILTEVYLTMEGMTREDLIDQFTKWAYVQALAGESVGSTDINISAKGGDSDRPERANRRERRDSSDDSGGRRERSRRDDDDSGGRRERTRRDDDDSGGRSVRTRRDDDGGKSFTRVDFNIGSEQNLNPGRLMGMINEVMNNSSINFGKIEIDRENSAIDIDSEHASNVAISLEGMQFGAKQLRVELSDKPLGKVGRPSKGGSSRSSDGGAGFTKSRSSSGGGYSDRKSGGDKYDKKKPSFKGAKSKTGYKGRKK